MVQLITFLIMTAALVVLVLQNLTPVVGLVILGRSVGRLPFSVWLLGAIAIGVLCTLLIYQLVPQKRAYRPIGQRLKEPAPEPPNRFVDAPDRGSSGRGSAGRGQPADRQNPYDSDWENFKAPEQWDDWGQQKTAGYTPQDRPRTSVGDSVGEFARDSVGGSVGDTVRDIESGWGDDDYETSARYASRPEPAPDIGWDEGGGPDRPSTYETRSYEGGWLYGNDAPEEPANPAIDPGEPPSEEPAEDVYDANYRVIIPPYDANDPKG